jgi:NAD(P)H-hydrate repair Nnr-like enzyme with NAD(P)H-hydrate dehydratase domain
MDEEELAHAWPYPNERSDKYARGVVGVDTGSEQYPVRR